MPRAEVDFAKRLIFTSVRRLVSQPEIGGYAGYGGGRAAAGQQAHRNYRDDRSGAHQEQFSAEITVTLSRLVDGFTAHVRGRIDGVIDEADRRIVEEVKSVAAERERLLAAAQEQLPTYCLQARLYALCLARDPATAGRAVEARVVLRSLAQPEAAAEICVPVPFDEEQCLAELDELLQEVLDEARQQRQRALAAAACAPALCFPYPALRPFQQDLIDAMSAALASSRPLLALAPTGLGKTICALYSALGQGLARHHIVLYLTAKTTGQQAAAKAFADLLAAAPPRVQQAVRALTLRAQEQMCPPGDQSCQAAACPYLEDFYQRVAASGIIAELLDQHPHLTGDLIYEAGRAAELCPYQLSLLLAEQVDLVIADYNYGYDRRRPLGRRLREATGREVIAVIDEAHNLFDRARGYESAVLRGRPLQQLRRLIEREILAAPGPLEEPLQELAEELCALLDAVLQAIAEALEQAAQDERAALDGQAVCDLDNQRWEAIGEQLAELRPRLWILARAGDLPAVADLPAALAELCGDLQLVCETAAAGDRERVPYVAGPAADGGTGLGVLCVNPARRLEGLHAEACCTIAMSATLSPLSYFADVLGFSRLAPEMIAVPSPFPPENRCLVAVPTVDTTYRARQREAPAIARLIGEVCALKPGRYIAFFPSFAFLSLIRPLLPLPASQVAVQLPALSQAARLHLLQQLGSAGGGPKLLLAVMGGVFSEAVDLEAALDGALIVGPALPPVGFEREVMRCYFDEHDRDGFAYAMLYPGMQRVIQAAGRVIRSPEHRGIIALIGARFAEERYAECFPADWYDRDPGELICPDPAERLAQFWRRHGAAPAPPPHSSAPGREPT